MRVTTLTIVLALAIDSPLPLLAQETGSAANRPPSVLAADRADDTREDQARRKPVENADVIAMTQEMGDDAVLSVIQANATRFDLSVDGLIALKKAGVSDRVITGMLDASRRENTSAAQPRTPPPEVVGVDSQKSVTAAPAGAPPTTSAAETGAGPAPAAPIVGRADSVASPTTAGAAPSIPGMPAMDPQTAAMVQAALSRLQGMGYGGLASMPASGTGSAPRVFMVASGAKTEFPASTTQRAVSKFKGSNGAATAMSALATEELSFATPGAGAPAMAAMPSASMGGIWGMRPHTRSVTYAWGVSGAHAARSIPEARPTFDFICKDIPGMDPDAYEPVMVRLAPTKDNYRLVGATRENPQMEMYPGSQSAEWVAEERVAARLQKQEKGSYTLQPEKALPPGEYAIVLRPVKHYKANPSSFSAGAQVAWTVWDFSMPEPAVQGTAH